MEGIKHGLNNGREGGVLPRNDRGADRKRQPATIKDNIRVYLRIFDISQGRGVRLGLGILDKFRREILADRKREKCAFPALSILPQVELGAKRVLKNLRKIDIALLRRRIEPRGKRNCAVNGAVSFSLPD